MVFAACLFLGALNAPPPPPPPAELKPWVHYARALSRDAGCPPNQPCVQLSRIEVSGQATRGEVTLLFAGSNLGNQAQSVFLLGPQQTVSVHTPRFVHGQGSVRLQDNGWAAWVQPGAFELSLVAQFDTSPSVALDLGNPVAQVIDRLSSGRLVYDASSVQHGGGVLLQSQAQTSAPQEPMSTRIQRSIRYGSVVTFTYQFSVSGLHEQTRLELPMLGDEGVESVDPPLPYTANAGSLAVTLTPGHAAVTVAGHFNAVPQALHKPAAQPYETWVLTSDARHPVQWNCDGMEIDANGEGRAFLLQGTQSVRMEPVPVNLEPGRQGAGTLGLAYLQGAQDAWMGELNLALTTAPNTDRLLVPTPQPPHYAERGGAAVRLFGEGNTLSLRVEDVQPIRVQWRDRLATHPLFSWLHLTLPAQHVYLDQVDAKVALQPGYVPLAVLGAEHASGDLLEGVQLYGVLIGLLGVALAQAARFPRWATGILAVLLIGLWAVEDFPRVLILVQLAGVAVIVRLPTPLLQALRQRVRTHRAMTMAWVLVGLSTLAPCLLYCSGRLLAALHPWSAPDSAAAIWSAPLAEPSGALSGGGAGLPGSPPPLQAAVQRDESALRSGLYAKSTPAPAPKKGLAVAEKSVRPVAFAGPHLPRQELTYALGALLPEQPVDITVLLIGPLLRGTWMVAEACGVVVVLSLLALRSRRLWQPETLVP